GSLAGFFFTLAATHFTRVVRRAAIAGHDHCRCFFHHWRGDFGNHRRFDRSRLSHYRLGGNRFGNHRFGDWRRSGFDDGWFSGPFEGRLDLLGGLRSFLDRGFNDCCFNDRCGDHRCFFNRCFSNRGFDCWLRCHEHWQFGSYGGG
ncbi:hypothetical protein, partial [Pseudomonas gingeri]|uniref:hypothetical protein n=1 Tax=Pseudomonas gingeri TaxID=117681 RepID=UPI001ADFA02F